jgi:hypothetical protein
MVVVAVSTALLLLAATGGTELVAGLTWTWGKSAMIAVRLDVAAGTLSYNLTVGREYDQDEQQQWLQSEPGPPRLFCDGEWHELQLDSHAVLAGSKPQLGAFEALSTLWSVPASADPEAAGCAGTRLNASFVYHMDEDAIEFEQSFPDGANRTGGAPQPECAACARVGKSTSVPLSEFPAFRSAPGTALHDRLGWYQWAGTFSNARSAGGVGLTQPALAKREKGFAGGQEGGPLVLFEEGAAHGRALVLSVSSQWFGTVLGMRPPKYSRHNSLVGGVQGDVESIPASHAASFVVVGGNAGINAAMSRFGAVLQRKFGTSKLRHDVVTERLGYWTDNGGYYFGPQQLTTAKAKPLFQGLADADIPIGERDLSLRACFFMPSCRAPLAAPCHHCPLTGCCLACSLHPARPLGLARLRRHRGATPLRRRGAVDRRGQAHLLDRRAALLPRGWLRWLCEGGCGGDRERRAHAAAAVLAVVGA